MSSPWPKVPFSEAVEVNPRRPVARGTLAPFVGMAALPAETWEVHPCRVRQVGSGGSRFTNGDTLFARITPCTENGKTGLVGGLSPEVVATGSTEFIVLSPRPSITLPRFVYYLAKNPAFRSFAISRMRGTSGRQRVPANVFDDFEVGVPPLPEQRKIAAILSSVDDAIEKTLAVIDQVQVVKRGLMQELLTRGLPGRHTRFKQTEIGEMPAEWRTSCIGDIARCDYGTSDALQHSGQGIPILRMGNLRDGRVSLDDVKYLAGDRVSESLLLFRGDVLFNRTNSADLVGKVAAFDHQARVSFASYLLRLRVKPNVGTGFWLSYLLNTGTLQKRLRAAATVGVSQVNINRKSLLATVIPVPPVEEQSAMVSILDSVCRKVEAEQDVAAQLAQVKSALMSVLLTGELRVAPDS